jgi:hypothetical protein
MTMARERALSTQDDRRPNLYRRRARMRDDPFRLAAADDDRGLDLATAASYPPRGSKRHRGKVPMNVPLGEWSGSDATKALHKTIKDHQEVSNQQTRQMIWLTWVIAVLTSVMLIGLLIQIYLALAVTGYIAVTASPVGSLIGPRGSYAPGRARPSASRRVAPPPAASQRRSPGRRSV